MRLPSGRLRQLVQEQDDGFSVQGEPPRRHEIRPSGGFVAVGNADQVARIGHLPEEQGDDLHSFRGVIIGEDPGFPDAVVPHQHDVLGGGGDVEQLKQLGDVDADVGHVLQDYLLPE